MGGFMELGTLGLHTREQTLSQTEDWSDSALDKGSQIAHIRKCTICTLLYFTQRAELQEGTHTEQQGWCRNTAVLGPHTEHPSRFFRAGGSCRMLHLRPLCHLLLGSGKVCPDPVEPMPASCSQAQVADSFCSYHKVTSFNLLSPLRRLIFYLPQAAPLFFSLPRVWVGKHSTIYEAS